MSIKSKTGFSGKLLYINKVEMDSRAEISINKFYQGMITLYRVSRDIVNLVREEINQYLVIELEEGEMITAVGLNFKSASGGMDNYFKLELQADILFKGERAYTNTSKFQEIRFEITEGNELIGLCPYDMNKNYMDILFYHKIDIPINIENKVVQLENGELTFCVYPRYQYRKESFSIGFAHYIIWKFNSAIDMEEIKRNLYIIVDFFSVLAGENVTVNSLNCTESNKMVEVIGICNFPKEKLNVLKNDTMDSISFKRSSLYKITDFQNLEQAMKYWFSNYRKIYNAQQAYGRILLEIATILNKCIAELISGEDEDAAISNLLRIISGYFDGDRSYIVQIDEKRNVCTNTYEYAMNGVTAEKDNLQEVPMEMLDIWMDSFRKNGLYYIPDIEEEQGQPYYETLKMQDITRLLAVPLNSDGKIIGFLGVDNPRLHYEDHTLLSSIQYFLTDSLKAKERKACLQYMSYRDMLTTLYNRNRYIQVLEGMQAKTVIKTGVAYIDINGLKRVNDLYGHEAGDRLIINTARSMLAILPENAYRVGGDEFVLICFDMDEKIFRSKVRDICDSIVAKRISVSVGVVWEESSSELETMLRRADDLMYAEKKKYYEKHGTM